MAEETVPILVSFIKLSKELNHVQDYLGMLKLNTYDWFPKELVDN
jgi:hypothetical protein